jgi:hypothetical protein
MAVNPAAINSSGAFSSWLWSMHLDH